MCESLKIGCGCVSNLGWVEIYEKFVYIGFGGLVNGMNVKVIVINVEVDLIKDKCLN